MEEVVYKPEGSLINTPENRESVISVAAMERAREYGKILEARALVCDGEHNLLIDLGVIKGVIPRAEAALGIADGSVRDIAIITRVNKPVCFKVEKITRQADGCPLAVCSRRAAQQECKEHIFKSFKKGAVIDAKITHLEPFGAFADIGCGIVALITIDNISVSRISHPKDRFYAGQPIKAVIKDIDEIGERITLSHKELLGTWEQNAGRFATGQTVAGIIRSIEDYGIFVELTPNLAGLAEYREGLRIGQSTAVYIKSIIPEKMKIKLSIIDAFENDLGSNSGQYFIKEGHIDRFIYSPPQCSKVIETVFE